MKPALAILATVLLLAGCGHASQDPFVGTWHSSAQSARLTIDRVGPDFYLGTLLSSQAAADVSFARHGNQLRVDSSQTDTMARAVLDYEPATGDLTVRNTGLATGHSGAPMEFSRISTGTLDPFGPSDDWVRVASASGTLLTWTNMHFRTGGGMARIIGTLTFQHGAEVGDSEDGLSEVKPRASVTDMETVGSSSDTLVDTPRNVMKIDEVSAHALTPGVWSFGIGATTAAYVLTIYVRK